MKLWIFKNGINVTAPSRLLFAIRYVGIETSKWFHFLACDV